MLSGNSFPLLHHLMLICLKQHPMTIEISVVPRSLGVFALNQLITQEPLHLIELQVGAKGKSALQGNIQSEVNPASLLQRHDCGRRDVCMGICHRVMHPLGVAELSSPRAPCCASH